jgi:hypothetical protein
MLAKIFHVWTVDSAATDHIVRDQKAFVDYRHIPSGSKHIYMGNNSSVEVQGIRTCELVFRDGHKLLLHDVLYAPDIRRGLVSLLVLVKLVYKFVFDCDGVTLYLGTDCISVGYLFDSFMVLNTVNYLSVDDSDSFMINYVNVI